MQELTQFLINKGHQQLTIVSGRGGPERVRLAGYEAAMAINNLNPKVQLVDKFDEISGYSASKIILNKPNRPTAIIAANDLMAIGAMRASKEEGLSIPKDIAVAGFDNIPVSQLVFPSLTTVERYQNKLGVLAVNLLLGRLQSKKKLPRQLAEGDYKIIERDST